MSNISELYSSQNLELTQLNELEAYDQLIKNHIEKDGPNKIILNANAYLASLLITRLLEKTEKSIRMVVGRLEGTVSNLGGYKAQVERCLNDSVDISIIFLDDPNTESEVFQLLKKGHFVSPNSVKMLKGSVETKQKLEEYFPQFKGNVHFAVYDNDKYRLEINPSNFAAIGSFNAPDDTKQYLDIFRKLETTSKKLNFD